MRRQGRAGPALVLLGAIAFANALGAVVVFPLAPFLAAELGIPAPLAAMTSVAYSAAAGLGGLAGAVLLRGRDPRGALIATLLGLGLATAASALAPSFATLLATRLLAGLAAGPLSGLIMAVVAAAVPPAARHRAVGAIVASYGLALVLGLPLALLLMEAGGSWRLAFAALSLFCLATALPCPWLLRREARAATAQPLRFLVLLRQRETGLGLSLILCASFASMMVSPQMSNFAVGNAGLTAEGLRLVYLVGGALGVLATPATGWAMDRLGPRVAAVAVAGGISLVMGAAFWAPLPPPSLAAPLLGLVLAVQLTRSTVAQAGATLAPRPADRVSYQCLASASTSLGQALGAGASTLLLRETAEGRLLGMPGVAAISVALAWALPALLVLLDRRLARRDA